MLLASLILSVSVAHAASSIDETYCKNEEVQTSKYVSAQDKKVAYDLCIKTREDERSVQSFKSSLDSASKSENCTADQRPMWKFWGDKVYKSPEQIDACQKKEAERTAKFKSLQGDVAESEKALKAGQESYKLRRDEAAKSAEEREKMDAVVRNNFNNMRMSIFDSKLQLKDAEITLLKMAQAIDNSAMGLYMRDRMAGLLNSDVMCTAVKQCPKPRKVKGSDLNSVFNSTMNTKVNSNYEIQSTAPGGAAKKSSSGTAN